MIWYLVLISFGIHGDPAMVTIPMRYVNPDACETAGKLWDEKFSKFVSYKSHECIAVPLEGEENG